MKLVDVIRMRLPSWQNYTVELSKNLLYEVNFKEAERTHGYGWRQLARESLLIPVLRRDDLTFRHFV